MIIRTWFPKSPFFLAALLLSGSLTLIKAQTQPPSPPNYWHPDPDIGTNTLAQRQKAQLETEKQFKVFYGFHFTDQLGQSGITFRNQGVADSLQDYKPIHYDHGSGIAVADVDGDGLYDILFLNHVGGNQLWKNLGHGKFANITDQAGIALPGLVTVGAAFADIDNDGDQDLVITTVRGGVFLLENDGQGHFKDITKESGIDIVAHSAGAMFFDYDNDGLVDLLICNVGRFTTDVKGHDGAYVGVTDAFSGHLFRERYEHSVLYKNLGHNRFKDVTSEMGLKTNSWTGDAAFADLNGDGYPGIYLLNMQGDNYYFDNQGGKRFVDKTSQYFPKTPWGAMGVKFFDYDNDGRMDLLVTDMHSDMSQEVDPGQEKKKSNMQWKKPFLKGAMGHERIGGENSIFGNAFYHNLGHGKFEEISDGLGVETYWPWGASVGDVNADGWDDIFVTAGMGYPSRYGINSMLLNNRGQKFLDAEFILGIEPRKETHSFSFSVDCDQPQTESAVVTCSKRTGTITLLGTKSTRSSAIFDLDDDGDLDIVTNDFNSEPMVLISDLAQVKPSRWLKIVLNGTKSNRNGLGATVRVHAGKQTYTKYNDGKSGYLSQSVLPLYFGLGDAVKVDRVEVDWPSGTRQIVTENLQANKLMTLTEPK
jgi:enediyne biosynthesis protein E4